MATAENNKLRSDVLFPVFIRREADILFEHPRKVRGRRKSEIVPDGRSAAVGIAEEAFGLLRFLQDEPPSGGVSFWFCERSVNPRPPGAKHVQSAGGFFQAKREKGRGFESRIMNWIKGIRSERE